MLVFFFNVLSFNINKTKSDGNLSEKIYTKIRRDNNVHKINKMLPTSWLKRGGILNMKFHFSKFKSCIRI